MEFDGEPCLSLSFDKLDPITLNNITLTNNMQITDCIYQDGAVYMLLRESRHEWSKSNKNIYSRGAVIKYNCFDGSVETIGWAGNDNKIENTQIPKMSLYKDSESIDSIEWNDVEKMNQEYSGTLWNTIFPNIYAPSVNDDENHSLSTKALYGPVKFVGLKPKKLVIADNGFAFYLDSDDLKFMNVNRVVTVDLEDFSMTGIPFDAGFNQKEDLLCQSDDCDVYYYMADSNNSGYQLGIPCADN